MKDVKEVLYGAYSACLDKVWNCPLSGEELKAIRAVAQLLQASKAVIDNDHNKVLEYIDKAWNIWTGRNLAEDL